MAVFNGEIDLKIIADTQADADEAADAVVEAVQALVKFSDIDIGDERLKRITRVTVAVVCPRVHSD